MLTKCENALSNNNGRVTLFCDERNYIEFHWQEIKLLKNCKEKKRHNYIKCIQSVHNSCDNRIFLMTNEIVSCAMYDGGKQYFGAISLPSSVVFLIQIS